MKKLLFFLLFAMTSGFADHLILDNQTPYPSTQGTKLAIQWASSAKEVDAENFALLHGDALKNVHLIKQAGKSQISIPQKAEYFRILAWSGDVREPNFHTNWIEIVEQKTYTLKQEYLVPTVLMSGTGC